MSFVESALESYYGVLNAVFEPFPFIRPLPGSGGWGDLDVWSEVQGTIYEIPSEPKPPPVYTGPIIFPVEGESGIYGGPQAPVPRVFTGPVAGGPTPVRRETVIVEDVSTEVERHPEGDYPAGSIFAPGREWGVTPHGLDTPEHKEDDMSVWTDIFSGAVDIWQGQPVGGYQQGQQFSEMGPAFPSPVIRPGGAAALPPSAAPVLSNGADCGSRRYVTLDRQTGKISCKRRRRRRLLTNRDLADLASLKTITGGGAALNAAVIRAVR